MGLTKEKPIVTLTIHGARDHGIETTNEIAKWLRAKADWFIINQAHEKVGNRLTLKFYKKAYGS